MFDSPKPIVGCSANERRRYACTCFEHYVDIIRSKLYYTASEIVATVDGRLVHKLREDSPPAHRTATYRCDDTRCCIIQFLPPDDEHNCARNMYRHITNLL